MLIYDHIKVDIIIIKIFIKVMIIIIMAYTRYKAKFIGQVF